MILAHIADRATVDISDLASLDSPLTTSNAVSAQVIRVSYRRNTIANKIFQIQSVTTENTEFRS